ncbi:MAG: DNA-3-methyladenine glycosylase 2 family protein [Planctomycetota bacterium]
MSPVKPLDRHTLKTGTQWLAENDTDLADLIAVDGVPPMWRREPGFATLTRIVLEQQVSLASAANAYERIRRTVDRVAPRSILTLGVQGLRDAGITRQKSAYLCDLAEHVESGELCLSQLKTQSNEDVQSSLERVKGIGRWTSDVYLLLALRRQDIWPTGDLALRQAIRSVKGEQHTSEYAQQKLAKRWIPWRSVAVRVLWNHYLKKRGRRAP